MTANSSDEQSKSSLLARLGIRLAINASGNYSDLGGSRYSPHVLAEIAAVNRNFLRMHELLEKSGRHIANLFHAENAHITPGVAAALMLGTAACMVKADPTKSEQLPDTTGLKSEVLIQSGHRQMFDHQVRMSGARLLEVGSPAGVSKDLFEGAFSERTAMVLHPAHLDGKNGTLSLDEVSKIARRHDVPVFVDAAFMSKVPENMPTFLDRGGDLVAFSAKYFGGPNAGGFVMGRGDLISVISKIHFTQYEDGHLKFGRPLKMDRQTVVAVVTALEDWLGTDHNARLSRYRRLATELKRKLQGAPGVVLSPMYFANYETFVPEPVNCLLIEIDQAIAAKSAAEVVKGLETGSPSIIAVLDGSRLAVVMDVISDEELNVVADKLQELLGVPRNRSRADA
ncbi:MAG TPA: hypothetical protein VGF89_00555 [Steroidobacteraceae bacterium]